MKIKEPFSAISHSVGALLAILAMVLLIQKSVDPIKPWHIVSFSVFGSGLFLLYTASAIYHWLPLAPKYVSRLQKLDYVMIYILIAATYTPVCLIPLRGVWGWSLFGVIWGLSIFGIVLTIFWKNLPNWFTITFYIFMGWLSIIAILPMIESLQTGALVWILIGGVFYTTGAIIHGINKPILIPNIFSAHDIFHIFVLLGSFAHFICMYKYLTIFE